MNSSFWNRAERSTIEHSILWEIGTGISKEVITLLMTDAQKKLWQELNEGTKILCYQCGSSMDDIDENCNHCRAPHRNRLGEEGTWHLVCFKGRGESVIFREKNKDYARITKIGAQLYRELAGRSSLPIKQITWLSRKQINILLSLQDKVTFIPQSAGKHVAGNNARIVSKTENNGYLHLGSLAKKFFSSEK